MGIAIFTKSRLIPRRDAIYRVRQSNQIASANQTKSRPANKHERGKSWKRGRDKSALRTR